MPSAANTFLLQLAAKKQIRLELASFKPGDKPGAAQASTTIDKKNADPECKLRFASSAPFTLVTVAGAPGEPYLFQCFEAQEAYTFAARTAEDYRITTLHSGYPDDNLDATCILVSSEPGKSHTAPYADDVIHVGGDKAWARRFNLLEEGSLFLFVEEPGDYQVQSSGAKALYRFEPFLINRPSDYRTPEFQGSGAVFALDRGFWVLTLKPEVKGVLKVALQQKGFVTRLRDWVLGSDPASPAPAKGACLLPRVRLDPERTYTLYLNQQPSVDHGVILRKLPLELTVPLPVTLSSGKEENLAFRADQASRLRILTRTEAKFQGFLDGQPWSEASPIGPGAHTLVLRNDDAKTSTFTLRAVPPPDPVPQILDATVKGALEPKLPPLREGAPLFLDLGVQEQRTALLTVATPGLYRIESTGLLKTSLTLRSAVRTRLFSAEANGVGRNALLSQYLKEGEYLLTVQTLDRSAGHAGLQMVRTELTLGGELPLGREAKAEVPAHRGVLYTFTVAEAGRHSLQTLGQNRLFPCRLEDGEGWPLLTPATPSNLTQELRTGKYRFLSLPLDVDTQRLTSITRLPHPRQVEGKGPHPLRLNEKLANRWREQADRARDSYLVQFTADLEATISLGNDQMQGFLKQVDGGEPPIVVPPGKGWSGLVPAGNYRLEVECSRINDLAEYTVLIGSAQLAPGLRQELQVPGDLAVRLAEDSVVELFSHGQLDVRGLLYRGDTLVDLSDDAYNDWNFRIARHLEAGDYRLRVEPVGGKPGRTTIGMDAPAEVLREPLPLDADLAVDLGGRINVLPLALKENTDLLEVRVTGAAQYGCILERQDPEGPVPIVTRTGKEIAFQASLRKEGAYRLRLWSADHQSEQARLSVSGTRLPTLPLERFARPQTNPAAARIIVARGGTFAPEPAEGFAFATAPERALEPAANGLAAFPAGEVILRWEAPPKSGTKLARVELTGNLRLTLAQDLRQELEVKPSVGGPSVVVARALAGEVACLALPPSLPEGHRPYRSASHGEFAAAVLPPGAGGRILLWNPAARTPTEVEVRLRSLKAPEDGGALAPGTRQDRIPPASGRGWSLPQGSKQMELVLEDGLVAYFDDGAQVTLAAGERVHVSRTTAATRLTVFNLATVPAVCGVQIRRRSEEALQPALALGQPFERIFPQPGSLEFTLEPGQERRLTIAGTEVACQFLDGEGLLHTGLQQDVRGGGLVTLTHGPGLVKAWLWEPDLEQEGRWGKPAPGQPEPLEPNSLVPLEGSSRYFTFTLDRPAAFRVRVECPAVVALGAGAARTVAEGYPGTLVDAYLQPGPHTLGIRALQGERLRGTAEFTRTDVIPLLRTLGPETLIHGGEARTFAFTAGTKRTFGIGLKAEQETLACQLLRPDGTELSTGSQQFAELEAGTYLLRVSLPPGQEPLTFTPVVVGLDAPGNGPPEETLREFLAGLGLDQ